MLELGIIVQCGVTLIFIQMKVYLFIYFIYLILFIHGSLSSIKPVLPRVRVKSTKCSKYK